jgi:hypothetical protein
MEQRVMNRKFRIPLAALATLGGFTAVDFVIPASAEIPIVDRTANVKKETVKKLKNTTLDEKKKTKNLNDHINCSISKKEKWRRLTRNASTILKEEKRNVELVRLAARKHNLPQGLALAVAQHESGMSECSGSPTGVKGVMQLTKDTASDFNMNRDINEQNIEGGMMKLKLSMRKCLGKSYNTTCLAKYYNASKKPGEQQEWAAGVAQDRGFWDNFVGENNMVGNPSMLTASTFIDYGGGDIGSGTYGLASVDAANQYLAGSGVANRAQSVAAMVGGIGTDHDILEAFNRNSELRNSNLGAINEAILSASQFVKLFNSLNTMDLQSLSADGKLTSSTPESGGAFGCDPVVLEALKIPQELWATCAQIRYAPGDGRVFFVTAGGAESVVATIQTGLSSYKAH